MPIVLTLALLFGIISLSLLGLIVYRLADHRGLGLILMCSFSLAVIVFGILFVMIAGTGIGLPVLAGSIILIFAVAYIYLESAADTAKTRTRKKYMLDWKYYLAIGLILISIALLTKDYTMSLSMESPQNQGIVLIWCAVGGLGILTSWLAVVTVRPEQST